MEKGKVKNEVQLYLLNATGDINETPTDEY
jgi:hypothetical protein